MKTTNHKQKVKIEFIDSLGYIRTAYVKRSELKALSYCINITLLNNN